jgi:hypothetical protein
MPLSEQLQWESHLCEYCKLVEAEAKCWPVTLTALFFGAPGMARSALTGAVPVIVVVTG